MAVKAAHACIHGTRYAKAGGELDKREEVQDTRGRAANGTYEQLGD